MNLHLGENAMVFSTYEISVPPVGARTPEETGTDGDFT